jgi:hypothetical protein
MERGGPDPQVRALRLIERAEGVGFEAAVSELPDGADHEAVAELVRTVHAAADSSPT